MPDLGIGTVLLVFSLFGKFPVEKLRSKTCAKGVLNSTVTNLSSFKLIPSMSTLDLFLKDLIMSCTWIEVVFPSSKSGMLSSGRLRYDSGVLLVGGTLFKISCPALAKKELNSSAISEEEVRVLPLELVGGC